MTRQPGILYFLGVGTLGLVLFAVLNWPLGWVPLSVPRHVWDLLFLGLTLMGLLLVPASIFVAAVGAMFPNYDRATPVTLSGGWQQGIFRVIALTSGYGLTAAACVVFLVPVSGTAALGFFILVAMGLVNAIWLVDASLSILDPDVLTQRIANYVLHPTHIGPIGRPSKARADQAFDDLSRLARGFADRRRPTAAAHAFDRMGEVWVHERGRFEGVQAQLASRVMGECLARNHPDLDRAIACFTAISGIAPDQDSRERSLRRLKAEEFFTEPKEGEQGLMADLRALIRRLLA